jgi:hypothetical protein
VNDDEFGSRARSEVVWVPKLEDSLEVSLGAGSRHGGGEGLEAHWRCGIYKLDSYSSSSTNTEERCPYFASLTLVDDGRSP